MPFSGWGGFFRDQAVAAAMIEPDRPRGRRPHPSGRQLTTPRTRHRQPSQHPHHHPRNPGQTARNRSLFTRVVSSDGCNTS
ncbi:hypothetical protein [Microbacterium lacus]|uniref:hypothetical protein n=1 Tax=Microbacterium lacus TaxID=415217 RepID=UPI00384B3C7F